MSAIHTHQSNVQTLPKLKVLIVGGGLGGFVLARTLKKEGHDVTLLDRCPHYGRRGYSLLLWPNALDVLDLIGLGDAVRKGGKEIRSYNIYNSAGKKISEIDIKSFHAEHGYPTEIYRPHLHNILRENIKGLHLMLGRSINALEENSDGVLVTYDDRSRDMFDLVVGADGVNSQVRSIMFPKAKVKFLGRGGWLFWVPYMVPHSHELYQVWGNGWGVGVYPDESERHEACLFSMPISEKKNMIMEEKSTQKVRDALKDLSGKLSYIVDHLPHSLKNYFFYPFTSVTMKKWYTKRVVLIGDAAHAVPPTAGQGACMAIEDGYVLAQEITQSLSRVTQKTKRMIRHAKHGEIREIPQRPLSEKQKSFVLQNAITDALKRFQARRKQRVDLAQKLSITPVKILNIKNKGLIFVRNIIAQIFFKRQVKKLYEKLIDIKP